MDIEQLQKENDELKERLEAKHSDAQTWANESMRKDIEINELKAHIERLRGHLQCAGSSAWWASKAEKLLQETPTQSLNHILSQVEEETIEQHVDQIRKKIDSVSSDAVKNALEYIAELFEVQPRKYKEQSNGL